MSRTFWKSLIKLKCKETKSACIEAGKFSLFMIGTLGLIALYFGFMCAVGAAYVYCTGVSLENYDINDYCDLGILSTVFSGIVFIFCSMVIGIKRWLQSNINEAKHLAEKEK